MKHVAESKSDALKSLVERLSRLPKDKLVELESYVISQEAKDNRVPCLEPPGTMP